MYLYEGVEHALTFFVHAGGPMRERDYQARLIRILKRELPGIIILKNDPNYRQGVPDLLLLYKNQWAALEVKVSSTSRVRPNQKYYVDLMHEMSFASFIYPENEDEVLNALQRTFRTARNARVSEPE